MYCISRLAYIFTYQSHTQSPRLFRSRNQSPQAIWSAGGRRERLWGTGMFSPQCNASRYWAANQKKKILLNLQSLSWRTPADQKHEYSGYEIEALWVSPGDRPLAKEPEDSEYEIRLRLAYLLHRSLLNYLRFGCRLNFHPGLLQHSQVLVF